MEAEQALWLSWFHRENGRGRDRDRKCTPESDRAGSTRGSQNPSEDDGPFHRWPWGPVACPSSSSCCSMGASCPWASVAWS